MNRTAITTDTYIPRVTRRTVLKGLGATLMLPWMERLAFAQGGKSAIAAGGQVPRRWACLIFANGVNQSHWWVKGSGASMELSKSLQPLAKHKEDLLFLDNLHLFDDTVGVHTPYFTNFLAGEKLRTGSIPDLAESVDQFMGRMIGQDTPVPASPSAPSPPATAFPAAPPPFTPPPCPGVPKPRPSRPRSSPARSLTAFSTPPAWLATRVSSTSSRTRPTASSASSTPATRTSSRNTSPRSAKSNSALSAPPPRTVSRAGGLRWKSRTWSAPPEGRPQNVADHMQMMIDIMLLAFRMDKTRIATLIFQKDVTGMSFNFLEGVSNTGMHSISHHRKIDGTLVEYQKINQFHVEMLARMIEKMKSVDEGNGTLLDNTMLLFGSTMRDGDIHDANDLPLILVGGKNCQIKGGRALRYEKLEDRRLCNLHLALAQRMGCKIDQFGNSHYPLPGLEG